MLLYQTMRLCSAALPEEIEISLTLMRKSYETGFLHVHYNYCSNLILFFFFCIKNKLYNINKKKKKKEAKY